jgi:hypothetical protein
MPGRGAEQRQSTLTLSGIDPAFLSALRSTRFREIFDG